MIANCAMQSFTFGSMFLLYAIFLHSAVPSSPFQLFLGEDELEGHLIALIKTNLTTLHGFFFVYVTNKGLAK